MLYTFTIRVDAGAKLDLDHRAKAPLLAYIFVRGWVVVS
jgi:hypothetical protein